MVIKVENLIKEFKEIRALNSFNLELKEGEILGLIGPNGSGKSTLLLSVLGIYSYENGNISVFGQELKPNSYEIKRKIGYVPQDLALFEELTVYENIDYFCGLYVHDRKKRKELVEKAIGFVGLEKFRKFVPSKLSGGLARRLNIACGIAHEPELIFLDEPTVAVDAQSRSFILEGIKELNRRGATVIYTSHYLEEVEDLCDRIAIIDQGRNIITGTAEELRDSIITTEIIKITLLEEHVDILKDLRNLSHVIDVTIKDSEYTVKFDNNKGNIGDVAQFLKEKGLTYVKLYTEVPTLNDVFLELTGKELRD
ncbi:MAG: putative ABC transporter ATP-binding protein YbhF [Spirochaetes bacterium ADurb.Bin315]|nr:ABC transporter ATP-binding protein [Spirochaetales bacterium]OQA44881.1 MAG: putative ABC transporter ATP-binding protein YbhF [Spirochaetes bacterium ADurb.Bin315]HOE88681.1 ABC transporter ATP-binding protein [Sphaerochaeta sp.]HOR79471.1 ABC transporter ATP-binding protein [Sphaerochaeta sp.]HPK64704.1 ABC transporter ATP-binding protein [Sphaerochaeta sp.]